MGTSPAVPDRRAVHEEMEQARQTFHCLLDNATVADLRGPSSGTKWTNEQLLFHMLFGYLIVRALLVLARIFSRLPDPASLAFARLLDAGRTPLRHGQLPGIVPRRPGHSRLAHGAEVRPGDRSARAQPGTGAGLGAAAGDALPTSWDPFFTDYMTLYDIYRYPTRHFDFHRRQLTLHDPG